MNYSNETKPSNSYSGDTKPSDSFSNDSKPSIISALTGTPIGLLLSLTRNIAGSNSYTKETKP